MRTPLRQIFLSLLFMVASLEPTRSAQKSNADWNLAVLDQIISAVPPGQTQVQIADMQVPVAYLQTWRNELAGGPQPKSGFYPGFTSWPGGNVYYAFDASVVSANQKVFLDCAAEWATFANLHFFLRTTQANYILITNNPSLNGGLSAVGMSGGAQLLQISPGAWNHSVVCHELGHALGLCHEHQRSDRDSFVSINTNNIVSGHLGDFVLLTSSQNKGSYDFLSVMHYSRNAFSVDVNSNTISPLPAYSSYLNVMGQRFDPVLSTNDRAGMAQIYGLGPGATNIVINTQDSGPGSLRAALYYACDHPGTTITFNIPTSDPGYSNHVFNILPTDALPSLVNATTLDGSSEPTNSNPNGPDILLNGALSRPPNVYSSGLYLKGTNCTVRSLTINNFPYFGILITGSNAVNNTVTGCYLGVDPTGTAAVTNGILPLQIEAGASSNIIGGSTAAERNIISGSAYQGLALRDTGTTFNIIKGNYIGVNATGLATLANAGSGIEIYGGAGSNRIGGVNAGEGNVISGNGNYGVALSALGVNGNSILGNYIGLDASGSTALPNTYAGVAISGGAASNTIGGFSAGARNVISGNGNDGVLVNGATSTGNTVAGNVIGLNPGGTAALPNGWAGVDLQGGTANNTLASNVISGNLKNGIYVISSFNSIWGNIIGLNANGTAALGNSLAGVALQSGSANNTIVSNIISANGNYGVYLVGNSNSIWGNFIGLNAAGTTAFGNNGAGVFLASSAQSNLIGGFSAGARNVISGNGNDGVVVTGATSTGNTVAGNFIGLDSGGTAALPNGWAGVDLQGGAANNTVASNVISGNSQNGIYVISSFNSIWGNIIGLNAAGTTALGNNYAGVSIVSGSQSNVIGGVTRAARNIISGNKNQGIYLGGSPVANNLIQGNYIGLNAAGAAAAANIWPGIEITGGASSNTIGGIAGARNFISGNASYGISLNNGASGNVIQGNTIGLNGANSAAIPNTSEGVICFVGAPGNQIGGTTPGAANLIAAGNYCGVRINDTASTNNTIRGNSIYGNTTGAIHLDGAGNQNLAAPVLSSAVVTTNTTVTGTYTGANGQTFLLDFYSDAPPAGTAQARTYLGSISVVGTGSASSFSSKLGALLPTGRAVTATATDPVGNTSSLSTGVAANMTSTPNDGIPDAWRLKYFGSTSTNSSSCVTGDPDHDGVNNLNEFLSGTNPTNAASVFKLTAQNPLASTNAVAVNSANGIVYRLFACDDLSLGNWDILADQVIGNGTNMVFTDPAVSTSARRFYRAQVLW